MWGEDGREIERPALCSFVWHATKCDAQSPGCSSRHARRPAAQVFSSAGVGRTTRVCRRKRFRWHVSSVHVDPSTEMVQLRKSQTKAADKEALVAGGSNRREELDKARAKAAAAAAAAEAAEAGVPISASASGDCSTAAAASTVSWTEERAPATADGPAASGVEADSAEAIAAAGNAAMRAAATAAFNDAIASGSTKEEARAMAAAEGKKAYKAAVRALKARQATPSGAATGAAPPTEPAAKQPAAAAAVALNAQERLLQAQAKSQAAAEARAATAAAAAAAAADEPLRADVWVSPFTNKGPSAEEEAERKRAIATELEERVTRLEQEHERLRAQGPKRGTRSNRL